MDRDEVLRIAKLARIAIKESDMANLQENFKKILSHFEDISKVNTDSVEPLFHFEEKLFLREDVAEKALEVSDLMKNAPDSFDNSFKIPKVFGDNE